MHACLSLLTSVSRLPLALLVSGSFLTDLHVSQADGYKLLLACEMLNGLLSHSPDLIPTAIKANVTPGLLRVLHELLAHPESVVEVRGDMGSNLSFPISCLSNIMWYRTDDKAAAWEALVDAGIVPLLCDLVVFGHDKLMTNIGRLVSSLVLVTTPGLATLYMGELPRSLAGLIKRRPPVAPGSNADTLYFMAMKREELLEDYQSFGLGPSLKRLARHNDPHTAAAAEQLLHLITKGKKVIHPFCALLFSFFNCHKDRSCMSCV
jgi:hypothetical protein